MQNTPIAGLRAAQAPGFTPMFTSVGSLAESRNLDRKNMGSAPPDTVIVARIVAGRTTALSRELRAKPQDRRYEGSPTGASRLFGAVR